MTTGLPAGIDKCHLDAGPIAMAADTKLGWSKCAALKHASFA